MPWYNASWSYRKKITIDQTQVDADLTDFPVYVSLKDSDILASARADMRDVLFTAADGSTKLSHELVKRPRVGLGTWTWYNDPRAIYHNGKTYIGAIDGSGNLYVGQYTHSSGALAWNTLTATLEADDHDNPALIVRPSDSKIVAFYSKHNAAGDPTLRYKVSTNAEDASSWGTEQTIDYSSGGTTVSYANPVILADDSNACYVINRVYSGTAPWYYARTTDYSTWGTPVKFWDPATANASSYVKLAKNGSGRIDFFATNTHPVLGATSLYHFYCAWDSGSSTLKWYNSAGTEQTLPMTEAKATLIYDGTTNSGWNHQIAIDGSGNPRVLFQKTVGTSPYDHRLMFSRWNGSAWTTPVEILTLGPGVYNPENYYTGNSCFDGNDTDKIYVGVHNGTTWEMQEWTTGDNGATWSKSRDITTGSASTLLNRNPYSPIGHDGHFACLWCSGSYSSFTSYNMDICCDPPIAHEAHVKVPSVSGTTDTEIYCYYGNAAATAQEAANLADVWADFEVVYHLEPQPASLSIRDSSGNGHHGTKKSWREPNVSETGFVVGNLSGHKYDKVDDYISTPSSINMAGWTAGAVEAVINHTGTGNANQEHTIWQNWGSGEAGILFRIEPNTGATANRLEIFTRHVGNAQVGGDTGSTVTPNQTNHVALTFDSTSLRGVINGVQATNTFSTSGAALDADASIAGKIGGYDADPADDFGGYQEEFRISNVARSTAWFKATYVNLLTPATFYTLGTEQDQASATENITVNLTGNGLTASTGNVTVTGGASVSPTGVELTPSVGTVTVDTAGNVTVNLTGNSLTATAGTPTVTGGASVTPTGNALSSAVGTVEATGTDANVTVNLTGVALVSSVGSVVVDDGAGKRKGGGLSRSRNRNRKRYLINGRVYSLTQSELVELLAQRGGDVKPETIKVERSQKPRLSRNRMTAQPTDSVDRRRASIEITLNPMETQFKPLTKADYMALAEAVEMLIDEQDMMDLLAYL